MPLYWAANNHKKVLEEVNKQWAMGNRQCANVQLEGAQEILRRAIARAGLPIANCLLPIVYLVPKTLFKASVRL